jgi:hypothetical protein
VKSSLDYIELAGLRQFLTTLTIKKLNKELTDKEEIVYNFITNRINILQEK